jgi:hypothetical protein
MLSEPLGRDWQHPYRLADTIVAVAVARQQEQKIWASISGDQDSVYEIWPGGRNVKWPVKILEKRHSKSMITPARRGPKEKNWK